ncbi:collagen alpha-1(XII) chain-like [Haliotis rubra]|uniref:collagen alpha-1(XII) chain-like n=1 Tax=Haliotis rubra TaxID=36100 RepID=UPI001EE4EE6D|nr:collagen alpha-1(XII) chain-like [Haliotis rubra]
MLVITLQVLLAAIAVTVADPEYIVGTKCPDKPADIVFVVDGSGSEASSNFKKETTFISNFVKSFNIGTTTVQVSVVQFATTVRNEFKLNSHTDNATLVRAIARIHWLNGETYTGDALNYVDRNSFNRQNGGRDNVDKIVIVLTDGESNFPNETVVAAKKLHDRRITVAAVGIGSEVNRDELNAIASNSKHVFLVPNFDALQSIHQQLTDTTCKLCDSSPIDIAFLLDGSGSEGKTNYDNQKQFVKLVIGELNFNGNATNVAMVTFATNAYNDFDFNKYNDLQSVNNAIDSKHYPNGESYTHLGLQYLTDHTFTNAGARYGSKHVAVVLTDGRSNEELLTKREAMRLKAHGVLVISVGIGSAVEQDELKAIASGDQYVLNVNSSASLPLIHDKVVDLLCESKNIFTTTPKPTTTTTTPKPTTHATTTPKPRIVCGPTPADILFLLDNSDSEGADNFAKEVNFVYNFANRFVIDSHHNQISAITFSSTAKSEFWFNSYRTKSAVVNAIKNIQYVGAGTNTAAGLKMARTQSFTKAHGARVNSTRIAIVITDGRSINETETLKEAANLKKAGVTIISIGIGFGQDDHELKTMASTQNYVFSVENFDALKTIQKQVIETTCQEHRG